MAIDYAALAAKHGGAPATNFASLASKYGGTTTAPPAQPRQPDLLDNAEHVVGSIFPGEHVGKAIGTLGGYGLTALQEKLGIVPKGTTANYDLSAPSPLQTLGDTAKGAALIGGLGAGSLASIGASALRGAIYGALAGAGSAATKTSGSPLPTGGDLTQTGSGAVVGGITGGITSGAVTGLSKLLGAAGTKITESVIKPSVKDIRDGFDVKTIQKYDLGGSLPTMLDKTEARMNGLTHQLNDKLAGSDSTVNLADIYKKTIASLSANKLTGFGSNTSMQKALSQLNDEITAVSDDGALSIPDAQIVKRAAGGMGAWNFGMHDPDSTARETVYNVFYNKLKTAIEENSPPGVKEINQQLSELIPVSHAIIRRIPVAARNNALSLGDIISLTAGAVNPHALGISMLSLASKSGAAGNLLARYAPNLSHAAIPLGTLLGGGVSDMQQPQAQ